MLLRSREDRIFRKYLALGHQIVRDGSLGREYESTQPRVLVVLKEPNDEEGGFAESGGDIRDFGRKYDERIPTWRTLALWSALIQNPCVKLIELEAEVSDPERRRQHLRRLAVVNLKKTSGRSTSRLSEIRRAAVHHRSLLQEQFKLYKPDVTITANVLAIVADLMDQRPEEANAKRFAYFRDENLGTCIDFYHPQQRRYQKEEILHYLRRDLKYHRIV